jgi:hypothetical protein
MRMELGDWQGLELGCEWMGKKVVLCLLFVGFQGVIENELKVWGERCDRLSVRHTSRKEFVRVEWTSGEDTA